MELDTEAAKRLSVFFKVFYYEGESKICGSWYLKDVDVEELGLQDLYGKYCQARVIYKNYIVHTHYVHIGENGMDCPVERKY